ncbi:hypothetical protein HNY73_007572 [Argiope bruennichi]|uniref:Uncharacterized protein n=1 Tax=Argiope bruennichi TaxID=94029 RepID=A0A8T0FEB8_ARGBR|nr:hypothetical protein HNY73_007572 [Argiope bruennichi]
MKISKKGRIKISKAPKGLDKKRTLPLLQERDITAMIPSECQRHWQCILNAECVIRQKGKPGFCRCRPRFEDKLSGNELKFGDEVNYAQFKRSSPVTLQQGKQCLIVLRFFSGYRNGLSRSAAAFFCDSIFEHASRTPTTEQDYYLSMAAERKMYDLSEKESFENEPETITIPKQNDYFGGLDYDADIGFQREAATEETQLSEPLSFSKQDSQIVLFRLYRGKPKRKKMKISKKGRIKISKAPEGLDKKKKKKKNSNTPPRKRHHSSDSI